jgi:phage tail tape-measure protein
MDEATRMIRYSTQNNGRPETPAQRRRRVHKRGHQNRAANMRRARVRDVYLPLEGGLVFKPYSTPSPT